MGMNPQHIYTIPTLCAILPTYIYKYVLCLLVVCRGGLWKAMGWVVQLEAKETLPSNCIATARIQGTRIFAQMTAPS